MRCPFNRSCYQLREEAHKSQKGYYIFCGFQLFSIYIYTIAQRLESIKTYTNGQNDTKRPCIYRHSKKGKCTYKIIKEEIIVFKKA